jgi:hypothetical protein
VIGVLAKVDVEDEYVIDGIMTRIVSMDLANNGYFYSLTM